MSSWITVAVDGELDPDRGKHVELDEHVIAVFFHNGRYFAIEGSCPHQGGPLGMGVVTSEGIVSCPWHAWEFCVADGSSPLSPALSVGTYPVRLSGRAVQVWIGDGPPEA